MSNETLLTAALILAAILSIIYFIAGILTVSVWKFIKSIKEKR